MNDELQRWRWGVESGWCRLSGSEKITAGLQLLELIRESLGHCSTPQTVGARRAFAERLGVLAERAKQATPGNSP